MSTAKEQVAEAARRIGSETETSLGSEEAYLVARGLRGLADFIELKAEASIYRKAGQIATAKSLEGKAEAAFDTLPKDWRW